MKPASSPPLLEIRLLGSPTVACQGKVLHIPRRKLRALLFYLATEARPVPRDQLVELLWAGHELRSGRRRLTEALTRLQGELPEGILQREQNTVALKPQAVWVDVHRFRDLVRQARALCPALPEMSPLPPEVVAYLEEALALWQGRTFLEDFSPGPGGVAFEAWALQTDETLQAQRLWAMERLAQHALALGEVDQALQRGRLLLELDPDRPALVQALIQALVQADRRALARQIWDETRRKMQAVYGVDYPDAFRRQVEAWLRVPRGRLDTRLLQTHPTLFIPYVGRQALLDALTRRVTQGGVVVLLGEAGQGKTRTLQELSKRVENMCWTWALSCHQREQHLPFQPWVSLLQEGIPDSVWQRVSPHQVAPLLTLVPELRWRFPRVQPPLAFSPEHMRSLILQGLHHVVRQAAALHPLLLCVDDVQWADRATWEALCYLGQRPPFTEGHALLLIAMRSEELPPDIRDDLESLAGQGRLECLTLEPLTQEDIRTLATFVLRRPVDEEEAAHLHRESGGNPLYSLEMLRWAVQNLGGQAPLPQAYPLPGTLQALVEHRLAHLPQEALQVLYAAAVVGHDVTVDGLRAAVSFAPERLEPALQWLVRQHFLSRRDGGAYRFAHDKIREAVLQRIPPQEARRLHGRLAAHLAEQAGDRSGPLASRIAEHYEQAQQWAKAFRWWYRAMQHAVAMGALTTAQQTFERAHRLAERHGAHLEPEDLWALYREHQILATQINDAAALERISHDLQRLARQHKRPGLQALAWQGLAEAAFVRNDWQAGFHYLHQALPLLRAHGQPIDVMRALTRLGTLLYMIGQPLEGAARLQEALPLADAASDDPLHLRALADVHYELAVCAIYTADLSMALHYAQQANDLYLQALFPFGEVGARSIRALIRYYLGEYYAGLEDTRHAHGPLETLQKWRLLAYNHIYRALLELELGNLAAAWSHAVQALNLPQAGQHPEVVGGTLRVQGDVWLALEQPQQAITFYERGIAQGGMTFGGLDNVHRLARCLARLGDFAEAERQIHQLLELLEPRGAWIIALPARLSLARVCLDAGAVEQARAVLERTLPELQRRNMQVHYALGLVLWGEALAPHDTAQATAHWRQACALAWRLSNVWVALYALRNLARVGALTLVDRARGHQLLRRIAQQARDWEHADQVHAFLEHQQAWLEGAGP